MAVIDDLIAKIRDEALKQRISEEVRKLSKQKKFGLVFEEHVPEYTPLYNTPIRVGQTVSLKNENNKIYIVIKVAENEVTCILKNAIDSEPVTFLKDNVVAIAEFGEPIYPYLEKIDEIENAPDSDLWHTLIEGDNYHALQLLEYGYASKVDCIYIDPPYNTRNNDWKYNNDYVDPNDAYTHSKWLSFMEKRLKLAKNLLNPNESVLIVTIDEKEYIHLGALLEELFPEAKIQMISSVINPKGSARDGFSRSDEYIFFVMFGDSLPNRLPLRSEWSSSSKLASSAENTSSKKKEPRWASLLRSGTAAARKEVPTLYYPIYVDPECKMIVKIGETLPPDVDRGEEIKGLVQVLPIRRNGDQGRWMMKSTELASRIKQGRVRVGNETSYGYSISYLAKGEYENVVKGIHEVAGKRDDGSLIVYVRDSKLSSPPTQWKIASHSASEYGTTLLSKFLGEKRFTFPKSLYAVQDTLRFFISDKSEAIVLDFFAGSGTTLHAVNLLNAEDDGRRKCIMVTNNEVSAEEARHLVASGYQPGDNKWEALGIARHVTWPRTVSSITGKDTKGNEIEGNYGTYSEEFEQVKTSLKYAEGDKNYRGTLYKKVKKPENPKLSEMKISDGFQTNANYFKLGFLDKTSVALGRQLKELLSVLWMKAGSIGKCPELNNDTIPDYLIFPDNHMAILIKESYFQQFKVELANHETISTVYLVTDSENGFSKMNLQLSPGLKTYQLYRDYLDNFRINVRRV